ncbi:hypothetical protein [Flagellimonas flava]|uniref:hypothetical protein n=1 Tax=Flagellimonas flava TaxID=570519 RepID=UPI003D658356
MKIKTLFTIAMITILWSCSSDDPANTQNPEPTVSELQQETVDLLTDDGNSKVWRIVSAELTNGNEVLDITDNFNVADDEFIFSGGTDGSLVWRRGHDINRSASTIDETLLDFYRSPKPSSFSFVGESASDLASDDFDIKVMEDGTVTATLSGSVTAKSGAKVRKSSEGILNFTLASKDVVDYKAPVEDLDFSEAFTFESAAINGRSPGMIGSYSDNSFFIVTKEDVLDNFEKRPERVIKFNMDDNSQTDYVNYDSEEDAVSKQLHIVNNQLIAFGARYVNTYGLDISNAPTSVPHNIISEEYEMEIAFTRFGISVQDDAAYIIGGAFIPATIDNSAIFEIEEAKNIYKWDLESQTSTLFATLPETRYGARGTIINNKMYVFGGGQDFYDTNPSNTIYIIDMDNPTDIETLYMEKPLSFSFVQKNENLIYVAGFKANVEIEQDIITVVGKETTIGVFNTLDNSFTELTHNLPKPSVHHSIHQMALFNDEMYIIYGGEHGEEILDSLYEEWAIYKADLN